jgi:membrane protease YdiL (CAAX protease family)
MSAPGRLAPAPYSRPIGPLAATGWSAAFLVLCYFALSALAAVRPGSELDDVNWSLLYAASVLAVLYAIARVHAPAMSTRELVGARPIGLVPAVAATFMGAAAMVPLGAIQDLIARKWPMPEARAVELTHLLAAMPRNERIAGVLAATLLMPVADELFFRGALATGVARDRGRIASLFTTSITFGLVSCVGDLHYLPMFVLLGLLLGHARMATGSVLASIGAHFAWRLADLARDQRVAGTIDPLVTATYPYPAWNKTTLALFSVATVAFALVLQRFGRVGGTDERDDRDDPKHAPPAPKDAGSGGGGDRDDDEGEGEG